jgi:prepilin-type N-terminal cleavage/methylation domain-containing protein
MKSLSNQMLPSSVSKQDGLSMIEMLITVGLLGIISVAAAEFFVRFNRTQSNVQLLNTRDALVNLIRRTAGSPAAMNKSRQQAVNQGGGTSLFDCINSRACNAPNQVPFTLFSTENTTIPVAITGHQGGTPAYFTVNGLPCSALANPACVLQATTYFIARCPDGNCGAAPNLKAITLEVHYSVGATSNLTNFTLSPTTLPAVSINANAVATGVVDANY